MKIQTVMAAVSRLAIDTSPLIYWVERDLRYRNQVRDIFTRIISGSISGFTSTVTLSEVLTLPLRKGDMAVVNAFKSALIHK